jgi:mRNA-degrading endonuclease RelE of RelBE toxin-antitoxin system
MTKKDPFTYADLFPLISYDEKFKKTYWKISDGNTKDKLKKRIREILCDHSKGKNMRNVRKGTQEVRIPPFRLSYMYLEQEHKVVFLDLYHKDEQ